MNYRLGLDIGTNSLGWSILELDNDSTPCRIVSAGVRIFNDGRTDKDKATLQATRREARSARRRRDRFLQRQKLLINSLKKVGLFPQNEQEMKALQKLNPLRLRAEALTKKLPPHHIGRALFHLNQRRGFQSNRKDRSEETKTGKVSKSVRLLLQEMGMIQPELSQEKNKTLSKDGKKKARQQESKNRRLALEKLSANKSLTYGSFLWQRQQDGKTVRAKSGAGADGNLYSVYPQRELYKDEFNKIWTNQSKHYPKLMTDEVYEKVHSAIFFQRPLKPQTVGKCSYITGEDRVFRAMPSFQRYRIYQDINHLEWTTSNVRYRMIDERHADARDALVKLLEEVNTTTGLVTWKKMKDLLKKKGIADGDFNFNFESSNKKGFVGNKTSLLMQGEDCVGPQWHEWPLEKQDRFIKIILDTNKEDDCVKKELKKDFDLSDDSASECIGVHLEEGTANLSLKAVGLLIKKMKDERLIQTDAVREVGKENQDFKSPLDYSAREIGKLSYYGEAFQDGCHIIPGTQKEEDKDDDLRYFGGVTNPTVHIALNQIRHVVNEIIMRYGKPYSIAIELARDLPAGKERREKIKKEQNKNQKDNERIDQCLTKQGQPVNRENRLRVKLWEEINKECPFSGKRIGVSDLFSNEIQVEHLIPFSYSLDNSRANKVLCIREANQVKGNNTPFEAFGNNPQGYNWNLIFERVKKLPHSKRWRFEEEARKKWAKNENNDFLRRHLNDTRYIGRLTKEYLECICPRNNIYVLTGRLTALLRGHWGLNNIIQSNNGERKNRDDHRHHAVDAIVIGMTTRSILQKVSQAARRAEELKLDHLFPKRDGQSPIDPWANFRKNVSQTIKSIVVSHKPNLKKLGREKTDGQLHNKTAYGIIKLNDDEEKSEVVVREPIEKFTTEKRIKEIRDNHLQDKFLAKFRDGGKNAFLDLAKEKNIKSLRKTKKMKIISIKDRNGRNYKAYQGCSNWGVEIYEHEQRWHQVVISSYEANQKDFKQGVRKRKPHPASRMVMRLKINDCIEINDDGDKKIMRLQKISDSLTFAETFEANVAARYQNKTFKPLNVRASKLRELQAKKIHISPAGRVNYECRRQTNPNV